MPIYKRLDKLKINKKDSELLEELRDLEEITYYKNYSFSRDFLSSSYETIEHVWSHGDKLYKLANIYYGNKNLFWAIGLFNNKPTDSHYKYGDVVFIPIEIYRFINDAVR